MRPLDAVRVRVPATTANLGPGFDALGLALDLHEEVELRRLPLGAVAPPLAVRGVNAGRLPTDPRQSLVYRGVSALYERLGRAVPPLHMTLETRIPRSGGLGGSAAAIVGGVFAANLLEGSPLDEQVLLELCAQAEGHPDNVAPALLGGLVVCVSGQSGLIAKRLDPPAELSAVLCIPERSTSTKSARGVLSPTVPMADAVFNLGRTALLIAAMQTGDWRLLRDAMDDRLHQPARGRIFGALQPVIRAALDSGAHGAALSGSGSAIIALATERLPEIGEAMAQAAGAHGFPSRAVVLRLSPIGAVAIP
jgi:homoserine kinase